MDPISAAKNIEIQSPENTGDFSKSQHQETASSKVKQLTEVKQIDKETDDQSKRSDIVELEKITGAIEDLASDRQWSMRIKVDDKSNQTVVQVVSSDGDVVRQIPSEEVVALAEKMEEMVGLLISEVI